jgi:hypothetical protein
VAVLRDLTNLSLWSASSGAKDALALYFFALSQRCCYASYSETPHTTNQPGAGSNRTPTHQGWTKGQLPVYRSQRPSAETHHVMVNYSGSQLTHNTRPVRCLTRAGPRRRASPHAVSSALALPQLPSRSSRLSRSETLQGLQQEQRFTRAGPRRRASPHAVSSALALPQLPTRSSRLSRSETLQACSGSSALHEHAEQPGGAGSMKETFGDCLLLSVQRIRYETRLICM